jgi:hypothetical protein
MTTTPPDEPDRSAGTDASAAVPPVDALDERISAALDGAAVGEARPADRDDLGRARARAIEAARDILAVPPPPLDDLTRRRMVRTAVAAAGPAPSSAAARSSGTGDRRRGLRVAVAAAAIVAVVGAGGWALTTLNHSSSKSSTAAKASGTTSAPETARLPAAPVDLHEVSNPVVLRQRVEVALGITNRGSASSPQANLPTTGSVAGSDAASTTAAPTAARVNGQASCVSTVHAGNGTTPKLLGTATYRAAPAFVVVVLDRSQTLIYVLASSDCRLLSYQLLQ